MPNGENEKTLTFSLKNERELEIKNVLMTVYEALNEKGYSSIGQIAGYILSEDPTFITNHKNARSLIRKIDRDELLSVLLKSYLNV
ncbi:MAG: IreB family regulatory phosphoprotein [Oscillospiraceae bacterium]|nr:IreB family regulatory phosphoprotein [Oscillospiraceae bacterium]